MRRDELCLPFYLYIEGEHTVRSHQRRRRRPDGWIGCASLILFLQREGVCDGAGTESRVVFVGGGRGDGAPGGWGGEEDYLLLDQSAEFVCGDEAGGEPGGGGDTDFVEEAGLSETECKEGKQEVILNEM